MNMKKSVWLAACLLALLLTACGQSQPEYPELAEIDLESAELATQENSLIRLSYPAEDWIGQPMTDPMILLYAETQSDAFGVNFNMQYSGEYTDRLTEKFLEELLQEIGETTGEYMAVELAEMRQVQGEPVIYMESASSITDELIDFMIEEGEWSEAWIESIGGRELLLGISNQTITVYAVVEGRFFICTGSYLDETHKQPLLEGMATAIATTEWVGP